ncbi:MAG: filamentous hemagglutinin N-terminal domain-containing protein [Leptolyngbyaceae bacterium]|nr:filamentous hemagglutinin N-terminal domain-containing protein [Leptolyngbyaceae bacterium]
MGLTFGLHGAIAQVVPDGSLSTTVTSSDQLNFDIEGGDRAGTNLFHSFDQFSIPTHGSARFNHGTDISTIISRITGGQQSTIDGLIQTTGTADLFLINPSGFVFGPNARLNIGGSFITTTADSLIFADNLEFSATAPHASPLLSIHTPIGLQMGTNPGAITLAGPGHALTQPNDFAPVLDFGSQLGLITAPGQTIGLIGGNINLNGASITAPGGRVELGSVRQGRVGLHQETPSVWRLNYDDGTAFGDIRLSQRSLLNVSGAPAGTVAVWGDRIQLRHGSIILSQNSGSIPAGDVTVNANTRLTIVGMAPNDRFRSSIQTMANLESHAQGGSIHIATPHLRIKDRAAIIASTFGLGRAGNVNINAAEQVDIIGGATNQEEGDLIDSAVGAITVFNNGNAGNIRVQTPHLNLVGGNISTSTIAGQGTGGNIRIDADQITLSGTSESLTIPGITAATFGEGRAGDVVINTRVLELRDGNLVDSSSTATGDAGNITVSASERIVIDGAQADNPSFISSNVVALPDDIQKLFGVTLIPTGQSGQIFLKTPYLQLGSYGRIFVGAQQEGTAGTLTINADRIDLVDGGSIIATNENNRGGDITLITDILRMDHGLINASTLESGRGGNITIQANEKLEIMGEGSAVLLPTLAGRIDANNVTQGIAALALNQGRAGEIIIQTNHLELAEGSLIATLAFNESNGGNIRIRSDRHIALDESIITTSTLGLGRAGDMEVQTAELILQNGSQLIVATGGTGPAGNLRIHASDQILMDGRIRLSNQTFNSGLSAGNLNNAPGNGGDINLTTPLLTIRNGAELSVSALAEGENAMIPNPQGFQAGIIHANIGTLIVDNGSVSARSTQGTGGNIFLNVGDRLLLQNQSIISAQAGTEASGGGNGGNIALTSPFLIAQNNSDIIANAFEGIGGNIQITTQGLFGIDFREFLTPASDITASSTFGVSGTVTIQTPQVNSTPETVLLPSTPTDESQQVTTGCENVGGSQFIVTGRGGVPIAPLAYRPWNHLLEDLGPLPELAPSTGGDPTHQSRQRISRQPINSAVQPETLMSPTPHPDANSAPSSSTRTLAPVNTVPVDTVQEATQIAIAPDGTINLISSSLESAPRPGFTPCPPSL